MNHINESIRDTQQQRMLGQYMIQKLKKEQTMANIPPEQAASNKRCLESLIQRYGTGLEDVVAKEREFERLIEAYQTFMRGDKKKMQRKVERKQQTARKIKTADEPLPAIGDQKAGRSQVGCKIRHELRKEYGERVRLDSKRSAGSKRALPTQPGAAPKPMSVRVRKSVPSGQDEREHTVGDMACDEIDLPPTPTSPSKLDESAEEIQETESQLSMTYVPSENQSLAQLIPDEEPGITVEIKPEEDIPEEAPIEKAESTIQEEPEEELETAVEKEVPEEEECLMLEGDSDPNVLIVNSQTELITHPSVTPKFEIVGAESLEEEKAEVPEPVADDKIEKEPEIVEPAPEKEAKIEEPEPATETSVEVPEPAESGAVSTAPEAESVEPELQKLIEPEEEQPELFQTAAVNLVFNVFQTLDQEAVTDDSEKADPKEVKFKSSPEIVYYDKQSPEEALACHPDDKLILSEDLSTAESELDEDAKALYHKVLSTSHTEEGPMSPTLRSPDKAPTPEEQLTELARELTDTVIKNASGNATPKQEDVVATEVDKSDTEIAETAKILTETALGNVTAAV